MKPEISQSIAELIVVVMSFLGWNTNEYVYLLPAKIQSEIVISISDAPQTIATTTSKSTVAQKPVVKTEVKKSTPTTGSKPVVKPAPVIIPKVVPAPKPAEPKPQPVYYPAPQTNIVVVEEKPQTKAASPIVELPKPKETETKKVLSNEERAKESLVNIFCSRIIGNRIQKTTGSGVVIDPSGVIITNAHVAEYFLLAQNGNNTTCFIRTGSPATNSYKAKLVYLPQIWVEKNKNNLSMSSIVGTGEHDYALLVITERVSKNAKNTPLDYLETSSNELQDGDDITLAGYPAGFSDVKILDSALYSLVKSSEVNRVSSFSGTNNDVINTSPTVLAEHGSSGGAVVNEKGELGALIVATNIDGYSGNKNIQAITLPYIKKNIKSTSGKTLETLIQNAKEESSSFEKNSVSILANMLLGN